MRAGSKMKGAARGEAEDPRAGGPLGGRAREASLVRPSASTRLLERCPPAALGSSETKCPKQPPAWLRLAGAVRATALPGKPDAASRRPPVRCPGEPGPLRRADPDGLPGGANHPEGETGSGRSRNRFLAAEGSIRAGSGRTLVRATPAMPAPPVPSIDRSIRRPRTPLREPRRGRARLRI
jgi:hypothetical protein